MTIQEILEEHDYRIIEEQFKGHGKVKTIACNCGYRYGFFETHRAHVAEVLDKHMQEQCAEAKAEALNELANFLNRPEVNDA